MAEEKKTKRMEINYVVPLRKHWRKAPVYKRSKRAINALKKFLIKHTKSENIKIGKELNELIFSRGFRSPPNKVKITVVKEENVVKANLVGIPYRDFKVEEKKKKSVAEKLKEKVGLGKGIEKPAEVKEEKKTEESKEPKEEKTEKKKKEKVKETKKKEEKPKEEKKKPEVKKKEVKEKAKNK